MRNPHKYSVLCVLFFHLIYFSSLAQNVVGSAMNEVFKKTSLGTGLNDPWEVTFGPDGFLWITEAKGYVVVRMDTATGARDTVLNLSPGATGFLTAAQHTLYNRENWTNPGGVPWPQGGMMGMALHPDFMHPTTPKKYVYIGYVADQGSVPTNNTGQYYTNFLVRFTFNTVSGNLESPVTLCDTLPGSKDHNSGRIIIAPIGGVNYLFYSSGDMGSGQYENLTRAIKAQNMGSYEGKILRFNLEEDGDPVQNSGVRSVNYNRWIPSSGTGVAANPYNVTLGKQSAAWNMGHRNVQGFAIANFGGTDYIYGSSHGPYSDDEINIMEAGKNYGHPLVIGDSTDGNYNGAKAGPSNGSLPLIAAVDGEQLNARAMGSTYRNPIFNFYKVPKGSTTVCSNPKQYYIQDIYRNCTGTGTNNFWKSEAPSGMGIYTNSVIPGWKNSLMVASLKWGRVVRVKLNSTGTAIIPVNGVVDTMPYFKSQNRYRDMAISPDGRDIFIIMDKSTSTSGPSQDNPSTLNCLGCVVKYRFLGYNDNAGASTIPTSIPISPGVSDASTNGTIAVINADNNNIWVPITDSLGNIIAEIDANGNNLDTIRTKLYRSGSVRTTGSGKPYLNRSITINPKNQPTSDVNIRLYLTAAELANLVGAPLSGLSDINGINIFKNNDANGSVLTATTTPITPTRTTFGSDYVVTASIPSFSTFYFASSLTTLPLNLVTFTGSSINQATHLKWETENEVNTASFVIERSIGGGSFERIGEVAANGNNTGLSRYYYTDNYSSYSPSEKLYYRLKMVDIDGVYKYSSIVSIAPDLISGRVTIIPNPVVSTSEIKVNITAPLNGKVHWKLIDNSGRVITQNNENLRKGNNNLMISVGKLPTGVYYMVVFGAGIDQKVKLQKL